MPVANSEPRRTALQLGQARFQRLSRGIAATRVIEGPGLPYPAESEGGGLVNGRHHRAPMLLGVMPGMDG